MDRAHRVAAIAVVRGVWSATHVVWDHYGDERSPTDRWITAGSLATRARTARIRCPECLDADLRIEDEPFDGRTMRWMRCTECAACHAVLLP